METYHESLDRGSCVGHAGCHSHLHSERERRPGVPGELLVRFERLLTPPIGSVSSQLVCPLRSAAAPAWFEIRLATGRGDWATYDRRIDASRPHRGRGTVVHPIRANRSILGGRARRTLDARSQLTWLENPHVRA